MKKYCFFTSPVSDHGFFVTKEEKLFCFGLNRSGQLGLNDKNDRSSPCESKFFKKTQIEKIVSISCGTDHSVFIFSDELFSAGDRKCGSFGVNCKTEHVVIPVLVTSLLNKTIEKVECGIDSSLFLTDKGDVFALGHNETGQLGCGNFENKFSPAKVKIEEKISEIRCGGYFSLFLTKSKKIFSVGENRWGELGSGAKSDVKINIPVLIPFFKNKIIKQFSVGAFHSFVIDSENNVFGFGGNDCFKLGGNSVTYNIPTPILGLPEGKIQEILCGSTCSFFVLKNKFLGLGNNQHGCLGKKDTSKSLVELDYFKGKKIDSVYLSSVSTYFITENQEIFGCGGVEEGIFLRDNYGVGYYTPDLVLLSDLFSIKERKLSHKNAFVTKLELSRNLKLLEKDKINFVYPNKQTTFIFCSTAVRSSYLKELILVNQFTLELEDKYYESVILIKDWMNGKVPVIKTLNSYKLTYFLSQKWFILDLNYYLVKNLDKLFDLESIIDLIFELEEDKQNQNSLFLQCQIILKKNHSLIYSNHLSCLEQKKSIESTSQLFLKVTSGIIYEEFPTFDSLEEYSKVKKIYRLKNYTSNIKIIC